MTTKIDYRKDIDGLRAIAILPVIFFHAGFDFFSGGFVGVDVFFVISGFLITSIIVSEIENKKFNYLNFYVRRFRRLFPVGFLIIFLTIILFMFIYPEHLFFKTLQSAIAALLFVSNMYFWQQGGYFETNLHLQPLLHTWSLSVEEQFYFIFPTILVTIFAFKILYKNLYTLIVASILISISLAIIYTPSPESFIGFYVLPTRFYELAIGSLVSLAMRAKNVNHPVKSYFFREIGCALIAYSILFFDNKTDFPSYNALIPVIGAALVILDRSTKGFVFTLISSRLFVFIGLISYSLYLWHWPLLVAHSWVLGDGATKLTSVGTIFLTFFLSYLTYRFIESPFRNKKKISDKKILILSVAGLFSLTLLSCALLLTSNKSLYDPDGNFTQVYENAIKPEPLREKCFDSLSYQGKLVICSLSEVDDSDNDRPKILLWGDSHGSAMIPAFTSLADYYHVDVVNNSGCPPLISIIRNGTPEKCKTVNIELKKFLEHNRYDLVFLVGAWNNYLNWDLISTNEIKDSYEAFRGSLIDTKSYFDNFNSRLVIIAQPPRFRKSQATEYIRSKVLKIETPIINVPIDDFNAQSIEYIEAVNNSGITSFDFNEQYCNKYKCEALRFNNILFKDTHHISNNAALSLGPKLLELIRSKKF